MPNLRTAAMSLAELVSYRDRYVVPEFQRVYGWGEAQLERLFSDLGSAMSGKGPRGEPVTWFFLGNIFLAAPEDAFEAQIADGQQRILTATMMYAAARDLAETQADADRLHSLLATPAGKFRFAPRDRDAAFFHRWVQKRGATLLPLDVEAADAEEAEGAETSASESQVAVEEADADEADAAQAPLSESQIRIIRNRDLIVEKLRQLGAEGRERLLNFHATSVMVSVIMVDTLEEARNAYASTQSRGLRQSETDKLKAELISDCLPAERSRLAGQWEECEAKLGRDEFAQLFDQLILIEGERRPQHSLEADLFAVFNLPSTVATFIEKVLVPSADAYRRICTAGEETSRKQRKISAALVSLLRCTHSGWKAPAILALRQFGDATRGLEAFFANLERLAAVLMINGADPHHVGERYGAVIRDIKRKGLVGGSSLRLEAAELDLARECLLHPRFALRDRFRMPVLLKLNDILAGEVQAIDPRQVSCEHILPASTPRRGPWRTAFRGPDGRYNGGTFTHLLGNVAILTHPQNREADSKPYDVKRGILKRSGFALSKHAAKQKVWNAGVIGRRSKELLDLLVRAWRLNQPG